MGFFCAPVYPVLYVPFLLCLSLRASCEVELLAIDEVDEME